MKYLNQTKAIGTLFAIASVLMAVACFTITNSFSIPDTLFSAKIWSVSLKDVSINNGASKVSVVNDKIDINVNLEKLGEIVTINSSIVNDGNFDALLNRIDITDINNIKIGTSEETGKTYYLSDYIELSTKYAKDNKTNHITVGSNVLVSDHLSKFTKNEVVTSIRFKNINELSEDAVVVLNQNVKNETGSYQLKFNLSICFNYIENTK